MRGIGERDPLWERAARAAQSLRTKRRRAKGASRMAKPEPANLEIPNDHMVSEVRRGN